MAHECAWRSSLTAGWLLEAMPEIKANPIKFELLVRAKRIGLDFDREASLPQEYSKEALSVVKSHISDIDTYALSGLRDTTGQEEEKGTT